MKPLMAILAVAVGVLAGCHGKPKPIEPTYVEYPCNPPAENCAMVGAPAPPPSHEAQGGAGFTVATPAQRESLALQLPMKAPKPGDCLIVGKKTAGVSQLRFIKCPKEAKP